MKTQRRKKTPQVKWRASWKGEVRLGLVRFTVEAINAHSRSGSDIHFHQLHEKCHRRIEYEKVCPVHGEVEQDEIVLGYEYAKGKYVEVDSDELDEFRTNDERALTLEVFIEPDDLDRIYFDGRMYYLAPAEVHDSEPYHLVRRALEEEERLGIGQVVFSGKEQLAAILPREEILIMAMLNYAPEIRNADELNLGKSDVRTSAKNLDLAKSLIRSMSSDKFSIDAYEDRYRSRVLELLNAKKKGKDVVTPEEDDEEEPVINLMEALKKSLPAHRGNGKHHAKLPRKRKKAV